MRGAAAPSCIPASLARPSSTSNSVSGRGISTSGVAENFAAVELARADEIGDRFASGAARHQSLKLSLFGRRQDAFRMGGNGAGGNACRMTQEEARFHPADFHAGRVECAGHIPGLILQRSFPVRQRRQQFGLMFGG